MADTFTCHYVHVMFATKITLGRPAEAGLSYLTHCYPSISCWATLDLSRRLAGRLPSASTNFGEKCMTARLYRVWRVNYRRVPLSAARLEGSPA